MKQTADKPRPPRDYFSRREQLRLLALVMTLGLVIVLMIEISDPDNAGLFSIFTGEETVQQQKRDSGISPDTSYQPALQPEDVETITITPTFAPTADVTQRYFPGVVPAYLNRVKDYRTLNQPDEADAWYNLWQILHTNDAALIDESSTGLVTFSQLYEQPQAFRGELVTIKATVKQANWEPAAKNNSAEIDGYYRLVLRMGKDQLLFLYVLQLPEGFPTGEKLNEAIEATGFSYKVYLYYANEAGWLAPIVLARNLAWTPHAATEPTHVSATTITVGVLVMAMIAAAFAWSVYATSTRLFRLARAAGTRQLSDATIGALDKVETAPTIGEQLSKLANKD